MIHALREISPPDEFRLVAVYEILACNSLDHNLYCIQT
jgi:hypothetical protein